MNINEIKIPSSDGVHSLRAKLYIPDTDPVGIFQIVHGMTEHIDRYDRFMLDICSLGYAVIGADNLGHGKSVHDDSELGFIALKNGWDFLCRDVARVAEYAKALYPSLPHILLGHSMGSFIVRVASERYLTPDKLIIMGTGGPNPMAGLGIGLINGIALLRGERHISPFIDKMAFGAYNKRFESDGAQGWLTSDTEIRKKYAQDKYCTFKFTLSAMRDLLTLCKNANTKAWSEHISGKGFPILLVSGDFDPVGDYGAGVKKVFEMLKNNGADVSLKLYHGYRHEILNDSCYCDVLSDIGEFIEK